MNWNKPHARRSCRQMLQLQHWKKRERNHNYLSSFSLNSFSTFLPYISITGAPLLWRVKYQPGKVKGISYLPLDCLSNCSLFCHLQVRPEAGVNRTWDSPPPHTHTRPCNVHRLSKSWSEHVDMITGSLWISTSSSSVLGHLEIITSDPLLWLVCYGDRWTR